MTTKSGWRLLFASVSAVVVLLIPAGAASAHTLLLSTSPKVGQHLISSPTRVSATFDEILLPTGGAMVVTDAEHHFVHVGAAKLDGATISVAVQPKLPDGTYQAAYRVISVDGHPIESAFTFTVGAPTTTSTLNPKPAMTGSAAATQTEWMKYLLPALAFGLALVVAIGIIRRRSIRVESNHDASSDS
ncbi:MAG: copper resistance protein CopC [Actinomycetota bacterium]|nr:copper resistance protein CopC [Actinomycetota bacterium]